MSAIEAVVFDMDGVLIDATEWHYEALNEALEIFGYEITRDEHLNKYNGLSTKKKLDILTQEKNFPRSLHKMIFEIKQDRTLRIAASKCFPQPAIQILLSRLKIQNIKTAVVTNSISQTTNFMLTYSGIINYFDFIITNEDINLPKPNPDGYQLALKKLGIDPENVLVLEDGQYGIQAARSAGIENILEIDDISQVSIEQVSKFIPGLI